MDENVNINLDVNININDRQLQELMADISKQEFVDGSLTWLDRTSDARIIFYPKIGNVKIIDSYLIKDDYVKMAFLKEVSATFPGIFGKRTMMSLFREWKAHNILYAKHFQTKRTKDTDLNEHESMFRRLGYWFINLFFREK